MKITKWKWKLNSGKIQVSSNSTAEVNIHGFPWKPQHLLVQQDQSNCSVNNAQNVPWMLCQEERTQRAQLGKSLWVKLTGEFYNLLLQQTLWVAVEQEGPAIYVRKYMNLVCKCHT